MDIKKSKMYSSYPITRSGNYILFWKAMQGTLLARDLLQQLDLAVPLHARPLTHSACCSGPPGSDIKSAAGRLGGCRQAAVPDNRTEVSHRRLFSHHNGKVDDALIGETFFFKLLLLLFFSFLKAASRLVVMYSHLSCRSIKQWRYVLNAAFCPAPVLFCCFFFRPDAEILTSLPTASVCSLMGVTSILGGL